MTSPNRATEALLAEAEVNQKVLTRAKASLAKRTIRKNLKLATRAKVQVQETSNQEKAEMATQEVTRVKALAQETLNQEKAETEILEVTRVKVLDLEISNLEHLETATARLQKQEVISRKIILLQVLKSLSGNSMIKRAPALEVLTADLSEKERMMATDRYLNRKVIKIRLCGPENLLNLKKTMD